jgi:RNA polymerase sigma factor (sigma-70 family)
VRTIAQREAYRLYGTRQPIEESERSSAEDHIEDEADSVIERLATWSALDRIQPADRVLIVRRYVLEQSSAQIATQLAIPAATVRVRLHRALKRLREEEITV